MILSCCVPPNGKSMTLKEIDTKCETLLHKRFGLSVDFDVERHRRAAARGAASTTRGVLAAATPLRKALQLLDTKWDNLFSYTDDSGVAMPVLAVMQEETARKGAFSGRWRRACAHAEQDGRRARGCRQTQGAAGRDRQADRGGEGAADRLPVAHGVSFVLSRVSRVS